METENKKHHLLIWTLVILGITALSFFGYRNPELFKAELTGGGDQTEVNTTLYIPNDYIAEPGDTGIVHLKAGVTLTELQSINIKFKYDDSKINILNVLTDDSNDAFYNESSVSATNPTDDTFSVVFSFSPNSKNVAEDQTLFRLAISLKDGFNQGSAQILKDSLYMSVKDGSGTTISAPTYTPGEILISGNLECPACGEYGACNPKTGICECQPGYDGPTCSWCATGYSGYPNCEEVAFDTLAGLVITLSNDSISQLLEEDREKAYSSVYLFVNSEDATGSERLEVEGYSIDIPAPGDSASTNAEKLSSIINDPDEDPATDDGLKHLLDDVAGVNVDTYPNIPGLIKLTASGGNTTLDGITSNTGEVVIVPAMEYTLTLHPTASYRVRIIGKLEDGSMQELNFNDVIWQPQPLNRVNNEALNGGLLEKGDTFGVGPVYAQVEKSSGPPVDSNQITVEVPSGPMIEYMRRIGSSPLVKGGRVTFTVKVSDVDQIGDIQDIRTSIVRSTADTYNGINADGSAIWFTATPFVNEIVISDSGSEEAEGEEATQYFKVYSIPVEIPQNPSLKDGNYKIVLSITDAGNNESNAVSAVSIGNVANGDVNGDGNVNMIDVIMAFQIATGENNSPTASQIQGADMNNNGSVTMLDVITLFEQVNQ